MKNKNVLISGASVAGPALAYWLRRYGFNPTVVERAPALRDGGYAVDFRGPAHRKVLERMGVLAAIEREQTRMGAMAFVDAADRQTATMPADIMSGDVEILRGDLARVLYEHSREGVEYVFGDSITSLTEGADGVRATFERGAPRTFDLVVGADGLHSNVRALAFGAESRFIRDLGFYVSIFTAPNHLGLNYSGRLYSVPGKTAALYSARGNAEAKAMFFFASPPLEYDHRDLARQKRLLADAFAGVGWEVPRLLASAEQAPDFYFDTVSQIHMDRWSNGRTVLLGDAAHCASPLGGNGTGLAMVGAYVLAGELEAAGGDYRAAFARYEAEMRSYVAGCQKQVEGADLWFIPRSRAAIWLRDFNFRLLPYMPWKGLIAKLASKSASAITLKDYGN